MTVQHFKSRRHRGYSRPSRIVIRRRVPEEDASPEVGKSQNREGRTSAWLNTISTALTALIAVPALVISLVTFQDAKSEQEEGNQKEAARISWYFQHGGPDNLPEKLVLENRSLRPVYDAILNIEDRNQENLQVFYIDGTISPCSRVIYALKGHEKDVKDGPRELFFRDTLNTWWRSGYRGGLYNYPKGKDVNFSLELDAVRAWGLGAKYEDLDGCG
ncbi:hypothetical protein [Streptomyces sp. NPDC101115]|uniref:hypothetical protein n=1 Tax=Streptomyces sp. NPDC101115 TaxID=3366106 RepID=UPI00381A1170